VPPRAVPPRPPRRPRAGALPHAGALSPAGALRHVGALPRAGALSRAGALRQAGALFRALPRAGALFGVLLRTGALFGARPGHPSVPRPRPLPRSRPVLVYDGDCGFCTACVRFVRRRVRPDADVTPWQTADLAALGVTAERASHEVLWVTPVGAVYGGAQAIARLLLRAGGGWAPLGAVLTLPGARWIAAAIYRAVADHRERLPGGTACAVEGRSAPGS
jgi:predicted DCC family thiol-disulfide oxidoreductase YuxK